MDRMWRKVGLFILMAIASYFILIWRAYLLVENSHERFLGGSDEDYDFYQDDDEY